MNKKRYWLRGGVIGIFFSFMIVVIAIFTSFTGFFNGSRLFFLVYPPDFVVDLITDKILKCDYGEPGLVCHFVAFQLAASFMFAVIGLTLGWLYGKIKSRNSSPQV